MIDALYYFIFVIVPIFFLGFQAALLPAFFFLKGRGWLSLQAFAVAGVLVGAGFGYVFAQLSGVHTPLLACLAVAVFGAISAAGWWFVLVKREGQDGTDT
jgi:hypothetical protein